MHQTGFFDLPDHQKRLSDAGDRLDELDRVIGIEAFRAVLDIACLFRWFKGWQAVLGPGGMCCSCFGAVPSL